MKPVTPVPRPAGWVKKAREPGLAWLERGDHRNRKRPHDYWSPFRPFLAEGFGRRCGYTAMYLSDGTVDHWVPWSRVRGTADAAKAYEWANLRYASPWFNSARRSTPVPDPYEVGDDWFLLRLPSLELEATASVPSEQRDRVSNALRWLRDAPQVIGQRQGWLSLYQEGEITLVGLDEMAPLLADALRRQPDYLLPADRT